MLLLLASARLLATSAAPFTVRRENLEAQFARAGLVTLVDRLLRRTDDDSAQLTDDDVIGVIHASASDECAAEKSLATR